MEAAKGTALAKLNLNVGLLMQKWPSKLPSGAPLCAFSVSLSDLLWLALAHLAPRGCSVFQRALLSVMLLSGDLC